MAWVESEPHLAATSVKRFFFWIQLSRLARVYTRVYNKRERSALEALLTLERGRGGGQEGFSFSSRRSIDPVRPTRFVPLSFLPFFLLLFFLFPLLLLFLFPPPLSLSLSSLLPSSSAQFERIMPAKQWHKGPAGLTRRAGSLEEQLPRILLQFLQYPSSKIR